MTDRLSDEELSTEVRERLDAAIRAPSAAQVTELVKRVLQDSLRGSALDLPARFREPRTDTYARRLLYRDPQGRYTIVVMTWGPRQGTALHDHAGIWCVECVVDGDMEVAQYDLVTEQEGAFRFVERSRVDVGRLPDTAVRVSHPGEPRADAVGHLARLWWRNGSLSRLRTSRGWMVPSIAPSTVVPGMIRS